MTAGRTITVGTRGSRLALRQTELLMQALNAHHPSLRIETHEVRTEGDRRPQASLSNIGGQGVFVKELEVALVKRDVDIAVHSLKDVPIELAAGLVLAAIPQRADSRDVLVAREGVTLATLPAGARIGTGSARRAVQLRARRPDLEPVDIRGNVDTRIRKVDEGEVDAVVLAAAGLTRLGLLERATDVFEPDVLVPAVGQGALAAEAREEDSQLLELLQAIDHRETHLACEAERAFLGRLGGGCRLPFGALATIKGEIMHMRGFISDATGTRSFQEELDGPASEPTSLGVRLAEALLEQGASAFVEVEAK